MRQDPAACRADAAVRLAERGFASTAALAAGEVPCRSSAPAHAASSRTADDLSIAQPEAAGRGAAPAESGTSDRPTEATVHSASAGIGHEEQEGSSREAFAWDAGLLAYECPLFARKFPANTSEQVLATFGELVGSAGL